VFECMNPLIIDFINSIPSQCAGSSRAGGGVLGWVPAPTKDAENVTAFGASDANG